MAGSCGSAGATLRKMSTTLPLLMMRLAPLCAISGLCERLGHGPIGARCVTPNWTLTKLGKYDIIVPSKREVTNNDEVCGDDG